VTIYEIQRSIQSQGVSGIENMDVCFLDKLGDLAVNTVELKYNDDGFPYILLSN
jgi:hypothetical protein